MKKTVALIVAAVLLLGALTACGAQDGETVSVQSVAMITGYGSVGIVSRYAGTVTSGQTAEVKKDESKTVKDVMVAVGDFVNEGDVLFTYDTDAMELSLTKLELEIEGYNNTVQSGKEELPKLEGLRDNAAEAQKLTYLLQIQSLQADIREAEYNKTLKERELELMRDSMGNTEVYSPLTGRVMTVNDSSNSGGDMYYGDPYGAGGSNAFITVMDMTTFRVEGKINEMNVGTLFEGMPVIVRSRLDESVTWTGMLESIDWENPSNGNENNYYYYGPTDGATQSSKYPFYIALDNVDGLMLGQHVFIEPDYGQDAETEGLWLPAWYINDADSSPWVWAANSRDKLEKRTLTLGEYDEMLDSYLITDGLTVDDYITFPQEGISAGMPVVRYDEDSFGGDMGGEEFYPEGEVYFDDGMGGEVYFDDGMDGEVYYEDGMIGAEGGYMEELPVTDIQVADIAMPVPVPEG